MKKGLEDVTYDNCLGVGVYESPGRCPEFGADAPRCLRIRWQYTLTPRIRMVR